MEENKKNIDLVKHEVINGGAFKVGLCYVKNYDGKFVNDYRDPREAMEPNATIDADKTMWPHKWYHAFRVNEDDSVDIVCYHNIEYSSYLRQFAWEIWMDRKRADPFPKGKWVEFPNVALIAIDSPLQKHHQMIADMLRFDGIDISQFGMTGDVLSKKVFIFDTVIMNGTVTMGTDTGIFATRELAEQTREDIIEYNRGKGEPGFMPHCTEVKEASVYGSVSEIPFYQNHKDELKLGHFETDPVTGKTKFVRPKKEKK